MHTVTLPDKLSALLRLAVHDARLVAKDPRYELDMDVWHSVHGNKCAVCMAGAVMVRSLGVKPGDDGWEVVAGLDGRENGPLGDKVYAVEALRIGDFVGAYNSVFRKMPTPAEEVSLISAGERLGALDQDVKHAPWEKYLEVADYLEAAGL